MAESVKYLCNVFHALKIVFANEAGSVLKACGLDGREVMRLFCQDTQLNISPAYLRPGFAFGGSCLPKEVKGFLTLAREHDVAIPALGGLLESNELHIRRAYDLVTRDRKRRIAYFGLAFKPGTDDLRDSPLVTLAERLLGKGYTLSIFDRFVELSRLLGKNKDFIEREIPHLDRLLQETPEAALQDAEVIVVGHADREARERHRRAGRRAPHRRPARLRRPAGRRRSELRRHLLVTSRKPGLAFVSPLFLFPNDAGGKIRSTNILRGLKGGAFRTLLLSPATAAQRTRWATEIDGVCDEFVPWAPKPAAAALAARLRPAGRTAGERGGRPQRRRGGGGAGRCGAARRRPAGVRLRAFGGAHACRAAAPERVLHAQRRGRDLRPPCAARAPIRRDAGCGRRSATRWCASSATRCAASRASSPCPTAMRRISPMPTA